MRVTVKLEGAVERLVGRSNGAKAREPIDLSLPDDATAAHVLHELGDLFGEPFCASDSAAHKALPAGLRVFVDGELCLRPAQTSLARDTSSPRKRALRDPLAQRSEPKERGTATKVTVVVMSPISGGSR